MKGGREEERKERNIDSFYDAHKFLIVQERKSPTQKKKNIYNEYI